MRSNNGFVLWLTGLPTSGKKTLAQALCESLEARGLPTEHIASGTLRKSLLDNTLGFSKADRDANCRRNAFAAQILARNGVIAVVSAVSPYRATRDAIRAEIDAFVEVYLSTPKETCVDRDTNGMWADALAGKIRGFTGVDDPYEPPTAAEVEIDASNTPVDDGVRRVLTTLETLNLLSAAPGQAANSEEALIRERLRSLGYVE